MFVFPALESRREDCNEGSDSARALEIACAKELLSSRKTSWLGGDAGVLTWGAGVGLPLKREILAWIKEKSLTPWLTWGNVYHGSLLSGSLAKGRQKDKTAGKMFVCDKRKWVINCEFCRDRHLPIKCSGLLGNWDVVKWRWSLAENFFKLNYCHACHTKFAIFFPSASFCVSWLFNGELTIFSFWLCTKGFK